MKTVITVRAVEGFAEYNHDNTEVTGEATAGEEFVAALHSESQEYFAEDNQSREIYVGEIDSDGNLQLDECFELVQEGISPPFKANYLTAAVSYMGNASHQMAWANNCVEDVQEVPEELKARMKQINAHIHDIQEELRVIRKSLRVES